MGRVLLLLSAAVVPLHAYVVAPSVLALARVPHAPPLAARGWRSTPNRPHTTLTPGLFRPHDHGSRVCGSLVCLAAKKKSKKAPGEETDEELDSKLRKQIGEDKYAKLLKAAEEV